MKQRRIVLLLLMLNFAGIRQSTKSVTPASVPDQLAAAGINILSLDKRGYGESGGSAPADIVYARPGRLVDAGGFRLNLYCMGSGSPTVVFDSGWEDWAPAWSKVQPEIARWTRVCSYDRAGAGFSEPGPMPRTSERIAGELHTALHNAGIGGPYIQAGSAFGGDNMRAFADRYMPEIAGLVMVDADPDEFEPREMVEEQHRGDVRIISQLRDCRNAVADHKPLLMLPPRSGRPQRTCAQQFFRGLPEAEWSPELNAKLLEIAQTKVAMYDAYISEMEQTPGDETYLQQHRRSFGARPIRVLTSGNHGVGHLETKPADTPEHIKNEQETTLAQARWLGLSSNAKQIFVRNSSEYIQFDQPDAVVKAVREVYDQSNSHRLKTTGSSKSNAGFAAFARTGERNDQITLGVLKNVTAMQLLFYAQTAAPPTPLPPGQRIDLGGYRLHLWCTGKGSPTVVLSPGSGDFSFDWALVQPSIAKVTRVCSYDRAGEAWSDLGPTPRTQTQEAFDLRRALMKAHIKGPYVLVGHSAGGMLVRLFAADYPADVAGMVLVDGSHEEDTENINGKMTTAFALSKGRPIPAPRATVTAVDGLDDNAIKKIQAMVAKYDFMQPKIEPPYDKLPADMQRLQLWAMGQPKHWAATSNDYGGEEAERLYKIDHQTPHPLGTIPLVVLSQDMSQRTDEHAKIHIRTQQAMAKYSERGRQIVVPGAGHHIQLERPEVVIDAIKQVLDAARHSTNRHRSQK